MDTEHAAPAPRHTPTGVATLKALSHPVRMEIFDRLVQYGPETASSLAAALGESSGVTSYHLRRLEGHGLVREVEGKGTARERWWERVPGAVTVDYTDLGGDESARVAADTLVAHWHELRTGALERFMARGADELSDEWMRAALVQAGNATATAAELAELGAAIEVLVADFVERHRENPAPDARRVQLQVNLIPLLEATP
ncbi:ArsR/SmtB family transcription factor [Agromyces seonyuensis]|uniref:Helix-turn-helix domain-containing protein n=1 Tax=Agromyces seonyuensis TaxID=2662446 RepID=A0A6I4NZC3_9MICO|nr:helix-turn-helix domain-containing protein [Agromyces seonyuensis]MWB97785.1 helix-turn-helix domain-containing protein [Agromyces seonyuensis]